MKAVITKIESGVAYAKTERKELPLYFGFGSQSSGGCLTYFEDEGFDNEVWERDIFVGDEVQVHQIKVERKPFFKIM